MPTPSVIAVYPGTFDPLTLGHEDIIRRATDLFETVVVAVAAGHHKKTLFPLADRIEMALTATSHFQQVRVDSFNGLLSEFALAHRAKVMVRGLRTATDFDYEFQLAGMNRHLMPNVETVFLAPGDQYQFVSSSRIREIALLGGNISPFVSPDVRLRIDAMIASRMVHQASS